MSALQILNHNSNKEGSNKPPFSIHQLKARVACFGVMLRARKITDTNTAGQDLKPIPSPTRSYPNKYKLPLSKKITKSLQILLRQGAPSAGVGCALVVLQQSSNINYFVSAIMLTAAAATAYNIIKSQFSSPELSPTRTIIKQGKSTEIELRKASPVDFIKERATSQILSLEVQGWYFLIASGGAVKDAMQGDTIHNLQLATIYSVFALGEWAVGKQIEKAIKISPNRELKYLEKFRDKHILNPLKKLKVVNSLARNPGFCFTVGNAWSVAITVDLLKLQQSNLNLGLLAVAGGFTLFGIARGLFQTIQQNKSNVEDVNDSGNASFWGAVGDVFSSALSLNCGSGFVAAAQIFWAKGNFNFAFDGGFGETWLGKRIQGIGGKDNVLKKYI